MTTLRTGTYAIVWLIRRVTRTGWSERGGAWRRCRIARRPRREEAEVRR